MLLRLMAQGAKSIACLEGHLMRVDYSLAEIAGNPA
jgi:hypothetical protein